MRFVNGLVIFAVALLSGSACSDSETPVSPGTPAVGVDAGTTDVAGANPVAPPGHDGQNSAGDGTTNAADGAGGQAPEVTDGEDTAVGTDGAVSDGEGSDTQSLLEVVDPPEPDVEETTPGEFVIFSAPETGISVTGSMYVGLAAADGQEHLVSELSVRVGDLIIFEDTKLPTDFLLDTRQYPPGALTLRVDAREGTVSGFDEVTAYPANSPFELLEVTPQARVVSNGGVAVVIVGTDQAGVTVSADFSRLDSGWTPGSEQVLAFGNGRYLITYPISADNTEPDGHRKVPVTIAMGGHELVYEQLHFQLNNGEAMPLRIEGALYVQERFPDPSPGWVGAPPSLAQENAMIVTGGSTKVTATFANPSRISGLIIGTAEAGNFYQIPLDGSNGIEPFTVLMRSYLPAEEPPTDLSLRVALRDVIGNVSPASEVSYSVTAVGSGDIQVSVAWDTPTDLDLHVVEPTGCELYYGNRNCSSGGELDLDSNPACSIDGINVENTFWPTGQAPGGEYTVMVDFYSDCCSCGALYTVTLTYCGKTEVIQGQFAPNTDDHGSQGDGVTVATFSNEQCLRLVRGNLRYEDQTFDQRGFQASTWKPLRHAVVELRDLATGAVIGTTTSDRDGFYEMGYAADAGGVLLVVVRSVTDADNGLRDIEVMNHPKFQLVYEAGSTPLMDNGEEVLLQDIDVTRDMGAGAFNIFDVLVSGYDLIRRMTGKDLGDLRAYWATGADTTDTLYCSKYFYDQGVCSELAGLSVQGKDTDRDEYDDMVILKEFFKFALEKVSQDDNPGGASNGIRDDSRRAWSEGVSTFFSCDVTGTEHFVNSRPHGVYLVRDIEQNTLSFGYETSDGSLLGRLSEYLVSAVLWDIGDNDPNESNDALAGGRPGIYDVIFNYFGTLWFVDRALAGIELVDFLDGWFCRGWGQPNAVGTILEHHSFPYDWAGPVSCVPSEEDGDEGPDPDPDP
uniref:Lipoprotein n=1 Tax=uncultured delta proteobacterium DeepAnt-32C6 TaxID=357895 RepID=Q2I6L5_9DELT|nr:uncharacterized protein [uncultured delta proteobacterium DeepAnt-32C6]